MPRHQRMRDAPKAPQLLAFSWSTTVFRALRCSECSVDIWQKHRGITRQHTRGPTPVEIRGGKIDCRRYKRTLPACGCSRQKCRGGHGLDCDQPLLPHHCRGHHRHATLRSPPRQIASQTWLARVYRHLTTMLLRQRRRSAGYTLAAAAAAAVEATTDANRAMSSKNIDVCPTAVVGRGAGDRKIGPVIGFHRERHHYRHQHGRRRHRSRAPALQSEINRSADQPKMVNASFSLVAPCEDQPHTSRTTVDPCADRLLSAAGRPEWPCRISSSDFLSSSASHSRMLPTLQPKSNELGHFLHTTPNIAAACHHARLQHIGLVHDEPAQLFSPLW
jgi:hypothetical protein